MCKKCSKNKLSMLCVELHGYGLGDIALKFESFTELVLGNSYVLVKEENDALQKRMLDLAISLALGYVPTSKADFEAKLDRFVIPDGSPKIRRGMRDAMVELFGFYGNRLPWALYGGYMFMVTRPNLHVAERLPDLKQLLPEDLPWECVDAVWHGLPPATSLYLHILSVINARTGTIPLHGCGCNHYLPPIREGDDPRMLVSYPAPTLEDMVAETEVPVSHMLLSIESLARGLPHTIGETEKSLRHRVEKVPEVIPAGTWAVAS